MKEELIAPGGMNRGLCISCPGNEKRTEKERHAVLPKWLMPDS